MIRCRIDGGFFSDEPLEAVASKIENRQPLDVYYTEIDGTVARERIVWFDKPSWVKEEEA